MVNRGQPSKDCFPCRKRKLRCDLREEGCGQCQRAELLCHGFRDPNELAFRDETNATKQKVLARQALTHLAKPTALPLGWTVRSRNAFFSIYVTGLSRSCDALVPLYARASALDNLPASIDAVSLAFMSFLLNSPELMYLANKQYVIAIHGLSQALHSPHMSASDETLQSVLLLDLYEKLANHDPRSPTSWMSHIQGAMSLVKARGHSNFYHGIACKLASRVAITLTISCGAATCPVPDELMSLRRGLDCFIIDAKWCFTALLVDAVNLRADVHNGRFACAADAAGRAKEIQDRLYSLETTLPPSWNPRRLSLAKSHPHVFGHYYDVYPNHFVTQVWNAIRIMRLEMNDILQRHSLSHISNAETSTSKTISDISRQICAAVPQFILPEARPENALPFSPLQMLQCCTLLSPLYLAAQLSTDNHMRDWIHHIMQHMVEAGNMKIARDVADILRTRPDIDYWTVYAMTGSYALAA
ncbi:hypothetical protein PSPO01_15726 [Paraphaeosphaeria sporulosa]